MIAIILKKFGYSMFAAFVIVSMKNAEYTKVFSDVIWLMFYTLGLIISLTYDDKDKKVQQRITVKYIFYSIAASSVISMLVGVARAEALITSDFFFYVLTIAASTLAPTVVRKLITTLPDTIVDSANKRVGSIISGKSNTEEEDEHL